MAQPEKLTIIPPDGNPIETTIGAIAALAKGIKINEIRSAVPELEALCNRKIECAENFTNLVKLVSLKSGIDASVLSTYITACCNDTLSKKQNQAEQLTLLFDEMGS